MVCLQEAFKRLENIEILGGHVAYTPQSGFRVPAVLVSADVGEDTEVSCLWGSLGGHPFLVSRYVGDQRAHAACKTQCYVVQGNTRRNHVLLQPTQDCFSPQHVVLGIDANISLNGFKDDRFVGGAIVPLTKVRSCADAERAGAFYQFMLNFGLRADNSWTDWDCVTGVGESQVDWASSRRAIGARTV